MTQSIEEDDFLNQLMEEYESPEAVDLEEFVNKAKPKELPTHVGSPNLIPPKPSLAHLGGTSLLGKSKTAKNLQAHEIMAMLANHPDILASELIKRAGTGWLAPGLMDAINDISQLNLFSTLHHMRQAGETAEYALIVKAPDDVFKTAEDNLAAHLDAMEPDSVVFIMLDTTRMRVEAALRRKGWRQFQHYEFIGRETLMAHEAGTLRKLLAYKPKSPLFVIRKLAHK